MGGWVRKLGTALLAALAVATLAGAAAEARVGHGHPLSQLCCDTAQVALAQLAQLLEARVHLVVDRVDGAAADGVVGLILQQLLPRYAQRRCLTWESEHTTERDQREETLRRLGVHGRCNIDHTFGAMYGMALFALDCEIRIIKTSSRSMKLRTISILVNRILGSW